MKNHPIHLIDQTASRIATLDVSPLGDHYEGTISLDSTPVQLKRLFEEYEEIVEGQIFSMLDNIEDKICKLGLRVVFDNGAIASVCDLQVLPSSSSVSFKTRQSLPV